MWGAVGLQPVGAGLSKLGLKARSCTGGRRAQAPGRVRWAWEAQGVPGSALNIPRKLTQQLARPDLPICHP